MINFIVRLFVNNIQCHITPDSFTFESEDKSLSLKTIVVLSIDAISKVLAIGDNLPQTHMGKHIMLFAHNNDNNDNKIELISAFLRYAFLKLHGRGVMVRPKIIFKNSNSLQEYLSGYQKDVLKLAATQAGAREIVFID